MRLLVVDVIQLLLGAVVLWGPGLAWTWALVPDLDWARFLAVSVIAALTLQPGLMYVLNVFFAIPLSAGNTILLSLALTLTGLAAAIQPRLEAQVR